MERKLIWVILLLGQLHGCKSCIEKERKVLLELKRHLVTQVSQNRDLTISSKYPDVDFLLPTWTNGTKSDCCRWKGIKCNRTSGRVMGLSLGQMNVMDDTSSFGTVLLNISLLHPFEEVRSLSLRGEPYRNNFEGFFDDIEGYQSLRRLRNLEILDLSFNCFNNSILPFVNAATSLTTLFLDNNFMLGLFPTKEIKDLTNLEVLNLSGNELTGSVSVGFGHLKKLKSLDLSDNGFSSSVELKVLKDLGNLENLDLSANYLNRSIPELIQLKKLKNLDLSSNDFSSPMELQVLNDLKNLEKLHLSRNFLNGSIPEFTHLKNLRYLDLSANAFSSPMELQALKYLTNLEYLNLRSNFLNGHMAVICEMKNLRELDLGENQLAVQLPFCLGNLKKLRVLDLSANQLRENLPSSFSRLESLEYLSLSDNKFAGFFSLNPLANLTKLKVFKLSSTSDMVKVETECTWQPTFQLSVVRLQFCSLENIPSFLIYQKNLRLVDLSSNKLSGSIPSWLLANNTELEVLQLQNNSFTLFQMPTIIHNNLRVLDYSANDIGGWLPNNIGRALPYLEHMNGSNNGFEGQLPSSMGDMMKTIIFLDMSYNNFSGKLPTSFVTDCEKLEFLKLSHNKFNGRFLMRGKKLASVDISDNLFTGNIGDGLRDSTILSMLDMSKNRFKGAIPSWISELSLNLLLISSNFLEGTLPPSLLLIPFLDLSENLLSGALPSLTDTSQFQKYLFLHHNNFTGPIPDTLLGSVCVLDLRNNKLSGSIPRFVDAQDIAILLLKGNNLTGRIPTQLCDLSNIRLLDLSDNKVNGLIPPCLYNLSFGPGTEKKMENNIKPLSVEDVLTFRFYRSTFEDEMFQVPDFTYQEIIVKFATKQRYEAYIRRSELDDEILDHMYGMDLSNNELSGFIPEELGNLSRVRALNLSHNLLSGSIPSSFSNLKDIESLDISYNKLQGSIPQQLTSLISLAVFDVSYNNLSGIIPQGRQFNTFNENSYLGNPLLCGPPTHIGCQARKSSEELENAREKEEDESAIDMLVFYYSTASIYVTTLICIVVLVCFDCRWGRAWLCIVNSFITSAEDMLF